MQEERNIRYAKVVGGAKLSGQVQLYGAKNAINKQLICTLLTKEPCVFTNVPRINEVFVVLEMLAEVGTHHEWLDSNTLKVFTPEITSSSIGSEFAGFNRIPILMIAPLVFRTGTASLPTVGGCNIGARSVDFHIDILNRMGIKIDIVDYRYAASGSSIKAIAYDMPYPSVGATENALLAAVIAEGTTFINNAAVEPEILDTINFLNSMGAKIEVVGERDLVIEGVKELKGITYHTIFDRIEAASFAAAAAATDGDIETIGAKRDQMEAFLDFFVDAGGLVQETANGLRFTRSISGLKAASIKTDVHPKFMTDWQQPASIMMIKSEGISTIHETVYEDRFTYTRILKEMGARIEIHDNCPSDSVCRFDGKGFHHVCHIYGSVNLKGHDFAIPDLRAGFALILAALVAEGESKITNIKLIERGYQDLIARLHNLGGFIELSDEHTDIVLVA